MNFSIQPVLENDKALLLPLQETDFEDLYKVASDPEIWKQHPNKDRYQREVFITFFNGALQSKGAFKMVDSNRNHWQHTVYDYNETDDSIFIALCC